MKKSALVLSVMAACLWLTGCGGAPQMEFDSADEAKEALNTASEIEIYADLKKASTKTEIVADGKVAGYLQGDTVYIDGEPWFSIETVTGEPINEGKTKGTTYGYYDADGNCLGYAQEQYLETTDGDMETFLIFMDADEEELDYYCDDDGSMLFDEEGNLVGSGDSSKDGVGLIRSWYTNIYKTTFRMEPGTDLTVDFMDRLAMHEQLKDDMWLIYGDHLVSTPVEIVLTIIVVPIILVEIILWIDKLKKKWKKKHGWELDGGPDLDDTEEE